MAETIAHAYVQIMPSMEGIQNNLNSELGEAGKSAGQSFSSGFGGVLSGGLTAALGGTGVALTAVAGAFAGITGGAAEAGQALVSGVADLAQYGDNIDKMSQKMGISAKGYQEWEAVMQHSGTSMETMKASMKTLANAVENGNESFARIGISLEDLEKMSNEDIFGAVIEGLQQVDNETERTYLAGQLLGRGATELGALLNTSAEETQAMKDRVQELGGVLSDDAVKNAAAFQDSLQDMLTGFDGVKNKLLADFLPSMTQVMDGVTNIFSGDTTKGLDQIQSGIEATINQISSLIPRFTEVAAPILTTIGQALITNIPVIMPAIGDFINQMGMAFVQYTPQLAQVGITVLKGLIDGFTLMVPEVASVAPGVIQTLAQAYIDNAPLLAESAYQLMDVLIQTFYVLAPELAQVASVIIPQFVQMILIVGLPLMLDSAFQMVQSMISGLMSAWPQIISAGAETIAQLAQGLISGIPFVLSAMLEISTTINQKIADLIAKAASWGVDLLANFIGGIRSKMGDLRSLISQVAELIKGMIGFSEPKEGPLSDFHTYAPDMMELFAKGIKDNENLITTQLQSSFDIKGQISRQTQDAVDPLRNMQYSTPAQAASVETQNSDGLSEQFAQAVSLLGQLVDKDPVEIGANASGIFDLVRKQNTQYVKANGRGAFA